MIGSSAISTKTLPGGGHRTLLVEGGASRTFSASLGAGERLHLCAFVLGGALSVEVSLEDEGAAVEVDGLFVGESAVNVLVRHSAPGCRSRQLIKGIVGGAAHGQFSGRIHVARGANRTDAEQHSRNIALTDTAVVVSRPELEIYADDVRCVHGATVGQLDPLALYYMRQRGISESDARRMQLEGFAMDITGRLPPAASADTPERAVIAEKVAEALTHL